MLKMCTPNSGGGPVNSGQVESITSGVWISVTVHSGTDHSGKWSIAPTPRLYIEGSVNSSNIGGSSWYVLNRSKKKDVVIDFLNKIYASGVEFYETILTNQGAVGSYLPAGGSVAYQQEDSYFVGQKIYADFANWIGDIPKVNYGIYTYEVDDDIATQIPSIVQGMSIEKAL
ncbi:MAG: hypothetical protein V7782_02140 [Psychromonas sp.]